MHSPTLNLAHFPDHVRNPDEIPSQWLFYLRLFSRVGVTAMIVLLSALFKVDEFCRFLKQRFPFFI